jgi:hypothetical protein
MDFNDNGEVERDEWFKFIQSGGSLPDFGTGPGHHGSFEVFRFLSLSRTSQGIATNQKVQEEYELHHWEQ